MFGLGLLLGFLSAHLLRWLILYLIVGGEDAIVTHVYVSDGSNHGLDEEDFQALFKHFI
jgi:hypothetical protein